MGVCKNFFLKAAGQEQVETVIRLSTDHRGILTGRVLDEEGKPGTDVCILLYDTMGKQRFEEYQLVDSVFSDENGVFILGPIQDGTLYAVYVYRSGIRIRQLELKS